MTRRWLCENIHLLRAFQAAVHGGAPTPLLDDIVNTTGRIEIAVFLDDKYPDQQRVRDSLLRGKAAGVRHVIPGTSRHTLLLATELGLDVLVAKMPPGKPKAKFGVGWKTKQALQHKRLYYAVKPEWIVKHVEPPETWRGMWRDSVLLARCDHTLVFKKRNSSGLKWIADLVEDVAGMSDHVHIFESGKEAVKQRVKGRQRA